MEVTGRIIVDIPMVEGVSKAGNPWKKKEWVLETINTPYPRKVKFHLFGDRADNVHIEVGKVYTVTFEIDSREFNGRWYTDIRAWRLQPKQTEAPAAAPAMPDLPPIAAEPSYATAPMAEVDDLPF